MSSDVMSVTSYAGAGVSVMFGLTLTEWGVIVGIVTALLTFVANIVWRLRNDRREQRMHDLEVERLLIYGKPSREALETYSNSAGPRCE